MEVILKEDVNKLGARGDVVKVAEGYGRNYLLPRKLAIQATAGNKAVITQMKAASVRRSAKEKTQAEELAKQFEGLSASFQRRSGEHDQLFGSVTSGDIADVIVKKGINLDRRQIQNISVRSSIQSAQTVAQPADIRLESGAIRSELRPDLVDQAVRQDIDFLENHLVDVRVPVIAGLRKNRHGNQVDASPVFPLYDLGHRDARRQRSRVQQCLGDSVAHGRPEQAIAVAICIDFHREFTEPCDSASEEQGCDMVADPGNGIRCAENGSPATSTRITNEVDCQTSTTINA